jgi:hypothetical protein
MDFHGEYLPKSLKWNIKCLHRYIFLLHTLDAASLASGATLFSLGAIFCFVFLLNLYRVLFSVMLFYSTCIGCQYQSRQSWPKCQNIPLQIFVVSVPSPIVQGITLIIASLILLSSSHYQTTCDGLQTAVELTSRQ